MTFPMKSFQSSAQAAGLQLPCANLGVHSNQGVTLPSPPALSSCCLPLEPNKKKKISFKLMSEYFLHLAATWSFVMHTAYFSYVIKDAFNIISVRYIGEVPWKSFKQLRMEKNPATTPH